MFFFLAFYNVLWYSIVMEKGIYNIKDSDLTYGRGYVYSLQYHIVWCTKYRKPQFMISDMVKILKGNTARWLFMKHPELKKSLWGGHLWNPSYCAVTVSDRSRDMVRRYINTQKEKE